MGNVVAGMFVILAVSFFGYHSRNGLTITCLDIGQGDCCVLKMPGGENFLIDGGSSNKKNTAVCQILPYLKNQGIATLDGDFCFRIQIRIMSVGSRNFWNYAHRILRQCVSKI